MSGSALPTICNPLHAGPTFRGSSGSLLLRPVKLLAPCRRSDQSSSAHQNFHLQASGQSVTLLAAGYNYDSHWTVLSKGLSPFGMTTSVAAP
jgi:hypothetical protein